MIAQIHGTLVFKSLGYLIVDVNGVGYKVYIPLSTFYQLPDINSTVKLTTHTHVREDAFQLYGFLTEKEKEIFQLLINVSGIGPKLANSILSGIPTNTLCQALCEGDVKRLSATPGVGKKTAERMVLELRDKAEKMFMSDESFEAVDKYEGDIERDVISALINLGYKNTTVEKVLREIKSAMKGEALAIEDLLKKALQVLSK